MRVIRHTLRWCTVLFPAAILALTSAMPVAAAAGRTETGSFPIQDHFVDPGASEECGFPVTADLSGVLRYVLRFAADGNAIWIAVHIFREGTLSGNGVSLSEIDRDTQLIDLTSGAMLDVGVVFRVKPPNGPPVAFDRGLIRVGSDGSLEMVAGPHPALEGDLAALCAALGG
jgi:hypothetical protein